METSSLAAVVPLAFVFALAAACSSSSSAGIVSTHAPSTHRPTAVSCGSNGAPTTTCTTDTDCASSSTDAGAPPTATMKCVGGKCSTDECLADADCGAKRACSCKGKTRGFGGVSNGNVCVAANCRLDSDCGKDGFCSPSFGSCGAFYGIEGYYCHTATDNCRDDADCGATGDAGFGQPWCGFDATAGKWTCMTGACAG